MSKLITQAAYAKLRGVSPPYINKLVKQGVIKLKKGKVDPDLSDRAIKEYADPARAEFRKGRSALDSGENDFAKARTIEKHYKAALAKLEYEEKIGKVVNADEVRARAFERGRKVRDALLNIPDRLGMLTHEHRELLRKELIQALEDISGE